MKILAAPNGGISGAARTWLRAEGLAVMVLSILLYWRFGARWWLFAALLLAPDLSMLGYLVSPEIGRVSYNIVHSYVLSLCIAIAAIGANSTRLLPLVCIWTVHIGMDRFLGYGLKTSDRFGDSHLGKLGKREKIAAVAEASIVE